MQWGANKSNKEILSCTLKALNVRPGNFNYNLQHDTAKTIARQAAENHDVTWFN